MASGTITLTRTGSGYLTGQIVWSSVSNGIQANTSAVTVQLQLQRSALNATTGTFNGTLTIGSESESISWYGSLPSMEWITIKTITVTVGHNADGNGSCYLYTIVHGPTETTMEGTNVSGAATVTLDTIPRYASIVSAADFTDEGNPVLTYSNPAGEAVAALQACISLDGETEFVPYTDIPKTGTSYTFALTEEKRNALRAAAANSKTLPVHFFIRSTVGGSTSYEKQSSVMSIVNAAPTISPAVVDTNSTTIALTGNSSILIALHSSVDVTFHATAQKYATIVSMRAENGTNVLTSDGKISQVQNAPFVFTVSDSRGNTTTQNAANRIIPYLNPTCSIGKNMPEGDGTFVLTVTGRFYNGSFGATTNGLTVQYRYRAAGGSYPDEWTTFSEATKNGNDYTAQAYLTGLDYQATYTFQARVIDSIHTSGVNSAETAVIAEPVFEWGRDDFKFNVPVNMREGCDILRNGAIAYAPAGYGLGAERPSILTSQAQVNTLRAFGLHEYYGFESACEGIGGLTHGSILTIPTMYAVTQFFFVRYSALGSYLKRTSKLSVEEGWNPWEWVNPPMSPGEEYRTTERYNGKPVYVRYTGDMGGLSTNNYTGFSFYETGVIDSIVSCEGNTWIDNSTKWSFPFIYGDGTNQFAVCGANASGGIYVLSVGGGLSIYTHCEFVVKYTKLTD